MAGTKSGCYRENIENGFVVTTSCQVYNSRAYCRYYCNDGYVKTAPTAYCAGNNKWVPSGSHPSEKYQACKSVTDQVNACDNIFFNNGYVVICPVSHDGSKKDCMYRCFHGYKPASSSVHCIRDEWLTSDTYSQPCIRDESIVTPSPTTRRPTVMTTVPPRTTYPRTTYPGYYDDPNLKMDVSPIVFVAAVLGGLLVIGLLLFVIFFRAHKKSARDARERSMFIVACDPLSARNDHTNNNDDAYVDDSQYREVARRIIAQTQSQTTYSPPPYDLNSSNINPTVQNTFDSPPAPPYSPVNENHDILNGQPSPPYSPVYNSLQENMDPTANDLPGINYLDNTRDHTTAHGINAPNESPPSYEEIQNCTKILTDHRSFDNSVDPPPPYTIDGDKSSNSSFV